MCCWRRSDARSSAARVALGHEAEIRALRDCHASLTPREREVMALVVSGLLNKQVGGELGISEITVKAHRGQPSDPGLGLVRDQEVGGSNPLAPTTIDSVT